MLHMQAVAGLASPLRLKPFVRSVLSLHSLQHIHKLSTSSRSRPRTLTPLNVVLPPLLLTNRRPISTISAILLPPVVFAGLIVSLWTWKCFMMVLFQNKIIYMPFLPPNARSDTVEEYEAWCGGVKWSEKHIRSEDGMDIALAVMEVGIEKKEVGEKAGHEKVVLYFQGNASSLPPRLPDISQVIRLLLKDDPSLRLKFIGLSYRGYWKSSGRPNEVGMQADAEAALQYALSSYQPTYPSPPLKIVIWGQSIGCAFASHLAAGMIESPSVITLGDKQVELETLILETPFTSASEMLKTLYPEKWLPYRYLSVFLWNRLDTVSALKRIKYALRDDQKTHNKTVFKNNRKRNDGDSRGGKPQHSLREVVRSSATIDGLPASTEDLECLRSTETLTQKSNHAGSVDGRVPSGEGPRHDRQRPWRLSVVMLEGEKDELVPREHGDMIEKLCRDDGRGGRVAGMAFKRVTVEGALHTQVLAKGSGRIAAAEAVRGRDDGAV